MASLLPEQIFIVGMNGSGTTMLLDHLSSHSMLYGFPGETKFLPYFVTHEKKYGDLANDRNFLKLWHDMKESVAGRIVPDPERIPIPKDWRERPRTAASLFDQIMRMFATAQGKNVWCEKTPMHVHHLGLLGDAFPNAKFIHIIRDGRDCAASFHRRWKFNPIRTIYRWKHAVADGRAHGRLLGPRYLEVRYEDVTEAPEMQFRRICTFLGLPFEYSVLNSARSRPEMRGSSAKSVTRNRHRAVDYFSATSIVRIERVAGRFLTELGYECRDQVGNWDPTPLALRWWELTDDVRRIGMVMLTDGRLFKPSRWQYVARRIRSALKQKSTLGS